MCAGQRRAGQDEPIDPAYWQAWIDALAAAGWSEAEGICAYAVFGVKAALDKPLDEGDRVELLRPLQLDPKEARRRRASRPVR